LPTRSRREQPIAGAVGHEQTDSVLHGLFNYRAGLHPVAKRHRPRRTQTAAKPKADQTQAARNAGEPAGQERPQRQDRPADVNSRRRRGERHCTPRGTRHHRGSADEHYGKGGSKQRGLILSPTKGAR
jgi:hypothetical protein